jgi:hypothetical protein
MEIATSYTRPFYEEEVRAIRPPLSIVFPRPVPSAMNSKRFSDPTALRLIRLLDQLEILPSFEPVCAENVMSQRCRPCTHKSLGKSAATRARPIVGGLGHKNQCAKLAPAIDARRERPRGGGTADERYELAPRGPCFQMQRNRTAGVAVAPRGAPRLEGLTCRRVADVCAGCRIRGGRGR